MSTPISDGPSPLPLQHSKLRSASSGEPTRQNSVLKSNMDDFVASEQDIRNLQCEGPVCVFKPSRKKNHKGSIVDFGQRQDEVNDQVINSIFGDAAKDFSSQKFNEGRNFGTQGGAVRLDHLDIPVGKVRRRKGDLRSSRSDTNNSDPFEELLTSLSKKRSPACGGQARSPVSPASPHGRLPPLSSPSGPQLQRSRSTPETTGQFAEPREVRLTDRVYKPLGKRQWVTITSYEELMGAMPAGSQAMAWLGRAADGYSNGKGVRGMLMSNGKSIMFVPSCSAPTVMVRKEHIPMLRVEGFCGRCHVDANLVKIPA